MWWFVLSALASEAPTIEPPTLAPGDPAPAIEASAWLRGGPVTPGASGKATLVEFTASWCGPCARFLPQLVAIARDHADRLDIVSVHTYEHDLAQVEAFVAEHAPGTLPPNVAYSPVGEQAEAAWMGAAGRDGIPSVFLVAADGTVAWIGYPESGLDRVLPDVISGVWDPAPERERYLRVQRREALMMKWLPQLEGPDHKPLPAADVLVVLETAAGEDPESRYGLAQAWFDALREVDPAGAVAYGTELAQRTDEASGSDLNSVAWYLATEERLGVDPAVARILSEAANQRYEWGEPLFLNTLAYVLWLQDDYEGAITVADHALAVAIDNEMGAKTRHFYEKRLAWFQRQAAKAAR